MYVTHLSLFLYVQYVQSANILCIFMFPSISHQIVYQSLSRELSLRGHNVTVVTTDPLNDPSLTNLTEISIRHLYNSWNQHKLKTVLSKDASPFQNIYAFMKAFDEIFAAEMNSAQLQSLIHEETKKFELILLECYPYLLYSFSEKFQAPLITLSSVGAQVAEHDNVGNPNHPILYPDIYLPSHGRRLLLVEKILSFLYNIWGVYHRDYILRPRGQKFAEKYFGHSITYVGDLDKNVSMRFPNVDPLIYHPRANVPAIAAMGLVHLNPVKRLPQDLQEILDEAVDGVVYVSFGTNIKRGDLEESLEEIIIQALSEIPYKVLWKWDNLPKKPSNVIIREWYPQQDLLVHPHIRAFVTQGGLQSLEEAISSTVPLVGLSFLGDQPMNVQRIVDLKIGIGLNPVTVTATELKDSIIEVSENFDYKKQMRKVRGILFDKPMSGLKNAAWWSEYVIRHKGAQHLRSPSADISWFNFLLLDVFLIFIFAFVVATWGSYMVIKFVIIWCIFNIKEQSSLNSTMF